MKRLATLLVPAINRSNRNNDLVVANRADGTTRVVPFGAQPAFSADSKWLAYAVAQSEADQDKLRSEQKPVQNRMGGIELYNGARRARKNVVMLAYMGEDHGLRQKAGR